MVCAKAQSGDSKATGSRQSHRKTAYLAWGKSFYCKNHAEHHDCHIIFQVCAYGIETVITFLFCGNIFIYRKDRFICNLSVRSTVILTYKTLGIVRTFFIQRRRIFDELFSAFKLAIPYLSHIVPILKGGSFYA